MKPKELNRYLINKLVLAEYRVKVREDEIDSLTDKEAGFNQLLEVNQSLLLWALNKIATESEDKVKAVRIPMSEVYEICKGFATSTERSGKDYIVKLLPKE